MDDQTIGKQTHSQVHTHACIDSYFYTLSIKGRWAGGSTHTHTHIHTRTHTHTHTHTHAHTHTLISHLPVCRLKGPEVTLACTTLERTRKSQNTWMHFGGKRSKKAYSNSTEIRNCVTCSYVTLMCIVYMLHIFAFSL